MKLTPLIHYWGAPGVGRSTSMSCLLDIPHHEVRGDHDHRAQAGERTVILRYSGVATKFYYAADAPDRPREVEPALRRLADASGVIFVADSQRVRAVHNVGALERLRADLLRHDVDLDALPVVFQLNKRDLPDIMDTRDMKRQLNTRNCSYVESSAPQRHGVSTALESVLRMLQHGVDVTSMGLEDARRPSRAHHAPTDKPR